MTPDHPSAEDEPTITVALPTLPTAEDEPTITVDRARVFYGLSRGGMFAAVKRGDIPSIRIGRRILLPTASVRRQLGLDDGPPDEERKF